MAEKTFEKNPDEIGALWKRKGEDGKMRFWGILEINGEKTFFNLFPNTYKLNNPEKAAKQPDYRIVKQSDTPRATVSKPETTQAPARKVARKPAPPVAQEVNENPEESGENAEPTL